VGADFPHRGHGATTGQPGVPRGSQGAGDHFLHDLIECTPMLMPESPHRAIYSYGDLTLL
jgi:hypothetical protein